MDRKIGFTCGAFDLLHAGHCLMLEEAKQQCDYLIVGLHTDPTIDRPTKNKPVQTVEERMIQLRSNRNVDEVVLYDTEAQLFELLKKINPTVRIIGADWKDKHFTGFELPITVYFNTRDHGYSSSSLRKRIYDAEYKG